MNWLKRLARATNWTLTWRRPEDIYYPQVFLIQDFDQLRIVGNDEQAKRWITLVQEQAKDREWLNRATMFGMMSLENQTRKPFDGNIT